MDATKQASGPKDHYATNPYRENKQEHVKRLELSKQAWFQNKEHMEKSQTMHRHAQRKQSKPFIKTWVYGCRPRPLDLDLHPT